MLVGWCVPLEGRLREKSGVTLACQRPVISVVFDVAIVSVKLHDRGCGIGHGKPGRTIIWTNMHFQIYLDTIMFGGECLYLVFDFIFKSWPSWIPCEAPSSGTSTRGHLQMWTVHRSLCSAGLWLIRAGLGWSGLVFKWGTLWWCISILFLIWPCIFYRSSFKPWNFIYWKKKYLFQSMERLPQVPLDKKLAFWG